jgi:hypothetical protein
MHAQETTMPRTAVGNFLALFTFALVATALGSAQSKTQLDLAVPLGRNSSWQAAQASGASIYKLVVVTVDNPDRRHSCRVRSFTTDKLVCSRFFGGPRIYGPEQVAAIIIPGEGHARIRILLGLNAAAGAVIWGTVVLTATCPACAGATALVALLLFGAAGAIAYSDYVPDQLLYLAPGQQLREKLGYVHD